MALNALVHTTIALVEVVVLGDAVRASMGHVIIVANSLLLFVPSTVTMQTRRKVGTTLSVPRFLLRLTFRLRLLLSILRLRCLPLCRGTLWGTSGKGQQVEGDRRSDVQILQGLVNRKDSVLVHSQI